MRVQPIRVEHATKGEIELQVKILNQAEIVKVGVLDCDMREGRTDLPDISKLTSFVVSFLTIAIEKPPEWANWRDIYAKEDREFMLKAFKAAQELQQFS